MTAENGFNAEVSVTIAGMELGTSVSPTHPFTIAAGSSQQVTFEADGEAGPGSDMLTVTGSSGSISHSGTLTLEVMTTTPVVKTYQQGTQVFLETDVGQEISRVGLETQWGGTVVEGSLNGNNFVNAHDTGREVQAALYDGSAKYDPCAGCTGVFGWDPVQGGDRYDHGSPVLAQTLSSGSIYVKTQPYQWYPDDKGGGPATPVLGDAYMEQTLSPVPGHPHAFQLHYKITHFGTDEHDNSTQEFPAIYVSLGFDRFVYYGGTDPWTNGPVTIPIVSTGGSGTSPNYYVPEHWEAFVDAQDEGLTVYVPEQFPYGIALTFPGTSGPSGAGTNYSAPLTTFTYGPNTVLEADLYIIAGDYKEARQAIYDLKNMLSNSDPFPPFGFTDSPTPNSQVSGTVNVSGWAFDNDAVSTVEVRVDGLMVGQATYGLPRPDVGTVFPNAPVNLGYQFSLDTAKYPNGTHVIQVEVTDPTGNVALFPKVPFSISN